MTGMLLVPDTILRSLAAGAVLVGITAVAGRDDVAPRRALAARRPGGRAAAAAGRAGTRRTRAAAGESWWRACSAVRSSASLASTAILVALALPALDLRTGSAGVRTIPDGYASKDGFNALERELGVGTVDTAEIVVVGDTSAEPVREGVERLRVSAR